MSLPVASGLGNLTSRRVAHCRALEASRIIRLRSFSEVTASRMNYNKTLVNCAKLWWIPYGLVWSQAESVSNENKGRLPVPNLMNFWKTSEGGGGFPIRKISCVFSVAPRKISLQKAQHSFPKIGGGGSEAVWKFYENSSNLVQVDVP